MAEENIEEIIRKKFHGDSCLYFYAIRDEQVWTEQLNQLPLNEKDKKLLRDTIHEIAMDCGGNPEAFEEKMAELFVKEIKPKLPEA